MSEETLQEPEDLLTQQDEPANTEETAAEEAAAVEAAAVEAAATETSAEEALAQDAPAAEAAEAADEQAGVDTATTEAPDSQAAAAPARQANNVVWIVAAVAALLAGLIIGAFAFNGGGGAAGLDGKTAVAEADLDKPIATYTYKGQNHELTIRDAITQAGSLEAAKDATGNYRVPSADTVLSAVRNAVLVSAAEEQGITVTDEDIAAYAEQTIGSADYASIAASYGMDETTVKDMMASSCLMSKLRESVMGDGSTAVAMPAAPPEPSSVATANGQSANSELRGSSSSSANTIEGEDPYEQIDDEDADVDGDIDNDVDGDDEDGEGDEAAQANPDVFSKDYADYIISLAGDEWDAQADTWVSADGPYAQALSRFNISSKGATYEAATEAYYVAYQLYTEQSSTANAAWTDYVNSVLSNATMVLNTLAA